MTFYLIAMLLTYILYSLFLIFVVQPTLEKNGYGTIPFAGSLFLALLAAIFWPITLLIAIPWGIYIVKTGDV